MLVGCPPPPQLIDVTVRICMELFGFILNASAGLSFVEKFMQSKQNAGPLPRVITAT